LGADLLAAAQMLLTSLLAAGVGFALLVLLMPRRIASGRSPLLHNGAETTFLFDGEQLVDATVTARLLLAQGAVAGPPWMRLMAWLAPRFADVPQGLAEVAARGRMVLPSREGVDPPLVLVAEEMGGLTRVTVTGLDGPPADSLADRATADELAQLRNVAARAPMPIWRAAADGSIVWANETYLQQAIARLPKGQDLSWPLPRLFEPAANAGQPADGRYRLAGADSAADRWFDLRVVAGDVVPGAGAIGYALPIDATVQAEISLKGFMQTLAKTFAHLPTGLAVFDQRRQLMLYNPALVDLTGLPPDLLSGRPTFAAVLDAMRERGMLPEPKDYRAWRRRLVDVPTNGEQDPFEEIWPLPGGQTYRVTGRPQPNGALALMIDDISTEMIQTRRYRADLELGQAVVDAMDEAIAVFSTAGTLVLSNAAYAALWGHDPGGALDNDATVAALCAHWRGRTAPTMVWDRAEGFLAEIGARVGWSDEVRMSDGRMVHVRFDRLAGGASLAGFRCVAGVAAVPVVFNSVRRSA
jgi:PAS domain-containing protein